MNPTAVSVALITNPADELLLVWDPEEECFALPSAEQRTGEGTETSERAAQRAAARALGVPVTVGKHTRLEPAQFAVGRTPTRRLFAFDVFNKVTPHADFADRVTIREPHLWLPVHRAISHDHDYEPFSPVSRWVIASLMDLGLLHGRIQHTAALVLRRVIGGRPHVLLRHEAEWGYALPGKRRKDGESYLRAAWRVARDELKVHPAEIGLNDGRYSVVQDRAYSPTARADTAYFHGVFERLLTDEVAFTSDAPLVWADLNTIAGGSIITGRLETVTGEPAPAGMISDTVTHILTARQLMP